MWSVCDRNIRTLFWYILSLSSLCSGYVITTPRRWTAGEESQVCVILSAPATADETITFEMKAYTYDYNIFPIYVDDEPEEEEAEILIPPTNIDVTQGTQSICINITLPPTEADVYQGEFTITGSLEGEIVNYTKPVAITAEIVHTFIQTDKYLYKPSQTVQFRILTVFGPLLQVSLEEYEEIWIENPSGIRVDQWLNYPNEKGLIHLSFQLSDEPQEGEYIINVLSSSGVVYSQSFKVEEFVLSRFEVTINPPKYILGTTEIITFEVCAKYTFGESVKGDVFLSVNNNRYGNGSVIVTRSEEISGCILITITTDELNINGPAIEYYEYSGTISHYYLSLAYSLIANAYVIEEGTGIQLNANEVTVQISRTALKFKDISGEMFYKPELPYIGKVQVSFPDGSPAPDESITACCEDLCKNISTDAEGILTFGVPPHLDCDIRIFAPEHQRINSSSDPEDYTVIMYKSGLLIRLKEYYSPSNSSLIISLPSGEIECSSTEEKIDFDLPVTFAATQSSALVNVQIMSRGQIVFTETFTQTFTDGPFPPTDDSLLIEPVQSPNTPDLVRGQFTVVVSLPKTVSPEAKVLVWYVRDDGEVVSDAHVISIMECLLNSVNIEWSTNKTLPGSDATISVTAESSSLCSLGVVDKSVELLTPQMQLLTIRSLLEIAQSASVQFYDFPQVNDYEYCPSPEFNETSTDTTDTTTPLPSTPPSTSSTSPPVRRKRREALPSKLGSEKLRRSERSIIIDPWFPIYYNYDDVDALYMCDEAGLYCLSNLMWETRLCVKDDDFYNYYYFGNYDVFLGSLQGGLLDDGTGTDDSDVRTNFPETWIWDLFEVSIDGSYESVETLPDTVTEWVGSAVCVHPSKGIGISNTASIITFKEFFIDLTLPPSVKRGEVFPVKISIFNYLNESLPIILILESPDGKFDILEDSGDMIGSGMRNTCVPLQDKIVLSIRIRAKETGDVNISVTATVQANAVSNCGFGIVQQQSDALIKPIRVNFEGFLKEETRFKYICTNESESATETWSIAAPGSIVPDSARGYVAVVGDLMGPTLENLGNLVNMPYGCGEQNMINFAPSIFVMQYLDSIDEEDEDIADKAVEFMRTGYQRELNYRHSDGSFSAFGEDDESGSTFLSAFVLKCFGQASEYITINPNDLNITREWLKSIQEGNGCFKSVGKLFNKAMQGGVESESQSLLTAYVVISLIEAGESYDSTDISEALSCINAAAATTNPYSLAIKAYAIALAKSPDTEETLERLMNLATESASGIYWEIPAEYESSKAVAVETASYAVLAILTFTKNSMTPSINYFLKVLPIIQWINTQRNGQGGFVSTQDTVIALQALAAFEETVDQGPVDLTVSVTMGTAVEIFTINEQNKLVQQSAPLPTVPISITFDINGKGCVLLQTVLRYNVPEGEINEAFSLTVATSTVPDVECITKEIEVCTSYLIPNQTSNMAIIDINLVSGYIPDEEHLKQINKTGLVKKHEVDGSRVIIYVDKISAEEICVSFKILRKVDVEDPKPGTVMVYDYYKPENKVTKTFTLPPPNECEEIEDTTT